MPYANYTLCIDLVGRSTVHTFSSLVSWFEDELGEGSGVCRKRFEIGNSSCPDEPC